MQRQYDTASALTEPVAWWKTQMSEEMTTAQCGMGTGRGAGRRHRGSSGQTEPARLKLWGGVLWKLLWDAEASGCTVHVCVCVCVNPHSWILSGSKDMWAEPTENGWLCITKQLWTLHSRLWELRENVKKGSDEILVIQKTACRAERPLGKLS